MGIFRRMINKIIGKELKNDPRHDKEEESWIPGGEGKDEPTKVTPEELGKVLCGFCYNVTRNTVNDNNFLKILGKNKRDVSGLLKMYYFYEMMTIYWFFTVLQIETFLKNEKIKNSIVESMYKALYIIMEPTDAGFKKIKEQFSRKHEEYNEAAKEKRDPNWLWPITTLLLNNLMQQKTEDVYKTMQLTSLLSSYTITISDLIENKYNIVLDKNNSTK